jgi:hypothetical protein
MATNIIARTSDAYTPCVVVHPNGTTQRSNVMQGRMMTVDAARADHAAGRLVWVATAQDAEAVKGG